MYGEHESESPRVPSPWDPFLPSPPNGSVSPPFNSALHNGIPKLVPEVEEVSVHRPGCVSVTHVGQGNIEYKLKLTHISNARFARLVTQLKWRLLEGGGQAYYELGVADSGALIGLSRADLEESLETLEMMAGEIGASVIVVKEIEVPPTIAALADKESGYTNPGTGEWTRKMHRRGPLAIASDGGELSTSAPSATETETDFSAAELTDIDDFASSLSSSLHTPGFSTPLLPHTAIVHRPIRTHPARPTAQSSPFIAPIDDDLALFSMEPEPAFRDDIADALLSGATADDELDDFSAALCARRSSFAGLEIAAVYKPRPVRQRAGPGAGGLGPTAGRHGKRQPKNKEKKVHPWHQGAGPGREVVSKEEKAAQRREARDRKREEKRNALIALAHVEAQQRDGNEEEEAEDVPGAIEGERIEDVGTVVRKTEAGIGETKGSAKGLVEEAEVLHAVVGDEEVVVADEVTGGVGLECGGGVGEARLIVEALVVRKMSIEEATLDFGRLALG